MILDIYQSLEKLKGKQTEKIQAKYIYQDETDNKIKEIPLDSAASSTNYKNPAKLIHNSIFGN